MNETLRIGLVSISDRASSGVYEDKGVPALKEWFGKALASPWVMETLNLPGQPKAIAETLEGLKGADGHQKVPGIFAAVPYCIDLIGGPYVETHDAVVKAFRPKSAIRPKG